jgi:hypothetical protein
MATKPLMQQTTLTQVRTAAAALWVLLVICVPAARSQVVQQSASAQMTLWQAIEAAAPGQERFTQEGIESGLGVRLTISLDQHDNRWFDGKKSLANGVQIKNIDLRAIGPKSTGFLVLNLDSNGTCISADQVRAHYKNLGKPEYSWPETQETNKRPAGIDYWSDQPWGRLVFVFNAPKLECLGAVAYHVRERS